MTEGVCETCGKPEREHRVGYSASDHEYQNAGCNKCGVNDRAPESKLCWDCLDELRGADDDCIAIEADKHHALRFYPKVEGVKRTQMAFEQPTETLEIAKAVASPYLPRYDISFVTYVGTEEVSEKFFKVKDPEK